jgi:hypothetical protein
MKQRFLNMIFSGLLAVSLGTAGALFLVTQAQAGSASCPKCDNNLGCAGSTCTCSYNTNTSSYVCTNPNS